MSKDAVAAFLRRMAADRMLQEELVNLAGKHGYRFSSDDLKFVELERVLGATVDADKVDDDADDSPPGFGMIEVPA